MAVKEQINGKSGERQQRQRIGVVIGKEKGATGAKDKGQRRLSILQILNPLPSDHSSVNISATNLLIENQTTGDDSLRCNLLSINGIKKFNYFTSVAEIIATGLQQRLTNHPPSPPPQ